MLPFLFVSRSHCFFFSLLRSFSFIFLIFFFVKYARLRDKHFFDSSPLMVVLFLSALALSAARSASSAVGMNRAEAGDAQPMCY